MEAKNQAEQRRKNIIAKEEKKRIKINEIFFLNEFQADPKKDRG